LIAVQLGRRGIELLTYQAQALEREGAKMRDDTSQKINSGWYEVQLRNFPEQMAKHMNKGLRKAGLSMPAQSPGKSGPSS
jgi:hypothetical protein